MQAEMPFFETAEDALKSCVQALGGAKKVAPELWQDKTIDNARDYLLACLNADRNEKLSYSQMMFIFKKAKQAGYHAGFLWFANHCGYDAQAIDPETQKDRATAAVASAVKALENATSILQGLHDV